MKVSTGIQSDLIINTGTFLADILTCRGRKSTGASHNIKGALRSLGGEIIGNNTNTNIVSMTE